MEKAIAHCKATIEKVVASNQYTYRNVVDSIDEADDVLNKIWSPVSHMNSVVSSDELRKAHDDCLPLLSEYGTWVGQHEGLYQAYKSLRDSQEYEQLDAFKGVAAACFLLAGRGCSSQV